MRTEKTDSYAEAVRYLERVPMFAKKTDPANTVRLLELLGRPERGFHVIHVAGTNGKGSTCAFLESVFRGMGVRTGLFTSPHLVRINERIRICGREISDRDFLEAFCRVKEAVRKLKEEGGQEPAYFEYLFAMGMCAFQTLGITLLICETGLGGRLDATNAIEKADAVVITSISLDHTKILGETVEEIASEKAGIIRPKTPVIYSAKDPAGTRVIAGRAEELGAQQIPLTADMYSVIRRDPGSISASLVLEGGEKLRLLIPFAAEYQVENACLAALCALRLGAGKDAVLAGIAHAGWPGRMEEIRPDVFLDGAHNPEGIRQLASEIRRVSKTRGVWLMTGIVSDKDYSAMVQELCRGVKYEGIIVTSVGGKRQLGVEMLAEEFRRASQAPVIAEPDAGKAYQRALKEKGSSVLFCAGSLYLAGEILALERA